MTFLATEMLLYLLSAAAIGVLLGWLVCRAGQDRKFVAMRADLTKAMGAEKATLRENERLLANTEAKKAEAVGTAKAEASRAIAELQQTLDAERLAVKEAQAELERIRAEKEEAIQEGQASGQAAIDQAMQVANAEKATAAEALAEEARSRAQIEELRLLIGAEKLAAETARTELQQMQKTMQTELEAERRAHAQAKIALEDIRSTLTKTLGVDIPVPTAQDADGQPLSPSSNGAEHGHLEQSQPDAAPSDPPANAHPLPFNAMMDMASVGDALNNPDVDEADIEDREDLSLDLSSTIDSESDVSVASTPPPPGRIAFRSPAVERTRPTIFPKGHPSSVDDLAAIDGISPELQGKLNDNGCYRYQQLTELKPRDIDWLAEQIGIPPSQIGSDRWIEQAKTLQLAEDTVADTPSETAEPVDRTNVAS
ncbi:MAG: hypothetical protein ACR2QJ_09835 [Geminicoccaceae bacterium]